VTSTTLPAARRRSGHTPATPLLTRPEIPFWEKPTCNQANASCITVSPGNDPTRWINKPAAGLRYQHSFDPSDLKTYGFLETAGKEDLTANASVRPLPTASLTAFRYDNLRLYRAGVAVTVLDLTAALDYIGGAANGQLAERPIGGIPMNAVDFDPTDAMGELTTGTTFGVIDSQGDTCLTVVHSVTNMKRIWRHLKLAPGLQSAAEYQHAHRHQGGFNFNQGEPGLNGATRYAHYQGVTFSIVLTGKDCAPAD
jgi:hypothetical protein